MSWFCSSSKPLTPTARWCCLAKMAPEKPPHSPGGPGIPPRPSAHPPVPGRFLAGVGTPTEGGVSGNRGARRRGPLPPRPARPRDRRRGLLGRQRGRGRLRGPRGNGAGSGALESRVLRFTDASARKEAVMRYELYYWPSIPGRGEFVQHADGVGRQRRAERHDRHVGHSGLHAHVLAPSLGGPRLPALSPTTCSGASSSRPCRRPPLAVIASLAPAVSVVRSA